ncbi:peptidoglycan D,D-transpeptidase FtsI family protein [Granulibacter bethesdensis]|uniref:peptidoglycan D,D-transpeptidase FtsI family protein n=1 Tax=Granulibacter bethesdensis TaxID=364410 RepID=UPI00090C5390|nr:penicillin-binding protein 2 [Granulibacter bethesdensis]APH58741.1 Penicillin-binding protein [Granulibacter bethesdensis]
MTDDFGTQAPPPDSAPRRPAGLGFGQPDPSGLPSETVRITAPDLARRALMDRTRGRLLFAAFGFLGLYTAVMLKLADATVLQPMLPHIPVHTAYKSGEDEHKSDAPTAFVQRATIVDRNNQILAISLPTSELYANPREMIDTAEAAHKLKTVLPQLDEDVVKARLASQKQFVYIARQITPRDVLKVNALGIPGVYFQPSEKRHYPLGRVAAQILGGVDVDEHGVAGVERAFEERLRKDTTPLRLSIDVRVQAVLSEELQSAMTTFTAIGACGIVMDVRTGEVIAMVSLPDYDANAFGQTEANDRFNRAVTGMYEPGSTFKLQTAALALDTGSAHLWDYFDAANNIRIGRFTITDFKGKHRALAFPEVLAYSSNLGAAHMAMTAGAEKQRTWLRAMGMFQRIGIELPEAGLPIVPPASRWKELTTMTVGFGHGIAVSPLHVVRGTATLANGGILVKPTILAAPEDAPAGEAVGTRVMAPETSATLRKLMRLVVTAGYGKAADVPGYFVGGKTGTAEKIGAHGYKKHANVSAFMSVFPMNAPRYAVYFMLDEPHGTKETGGYSTAGQVSAPGAGRVIARIGPMLGLMPAPEDKRAAIQASLDIPLQPGVPAGARRTMVSSAEEKANAAREKAALAAEKRSAREQASPEVSTPTERQLREQHIKDLRHQARFDVPAGHDDAE